MNWFGSEIEARVLIQRSENEEGVLWFDAILLDFNFVGGADAVAQKEIADVVGRFFFCGEEGIGELFLEVAVQVEVGAARVDHHFGGVVIEKKRHVHALGRDLDPLLVFTGLLPLPGEGAVVVAGPGRDGGEHGVGSDGEATEFDQSERGAANFGNRRVEDEVTPLQEAETLDEEIDPGAESKGAIKDDGAGI